MCRSSKFSASCKACRATISASVNTSGRLRVLTAEAWSCLRQFAGHQGGTTAVAFSPDGKLLISASADTTLLLWDAASLVPGPAAARDLTAVELEPLWSDLAGADAAQAHRAIWSMVAAPRSSVAFLKERLRPVLRAEPQRVAQLLTDLNSDRFAIREKAANELENLGESVASGLRKALYKEQSLEARRRIERLLAKQDGAALRFGRAIEVLEHIQSRDAEQLLQSLAQGDAGACLTRQAKAALDRQRRRMNAGA